VTLLPTEVRRAAAVTGVPKPGDPGLGPGTRADCHVGHHESRAQAQGHRQPPTVGIGRRVMVTAAPMAMGGMRGRRRRSCWSLIAISFPRHQSP